MNNDSYDDNTTYICRSCSVSLSTATLPVDEEDYDEHKEIYLSAWNAKMNRLLNK